jgi:predicted sugar kinase
LKINALAKFEDNVKHKVELMQKRGIKRLEFSFGGIKYEIIKSKVQDNVYDVNEYSIAENKVLEFPTFLRA